MEKCFTLNKSFIRGDQFNCLFSGQNQRKHFYNNNKCYSSAVRKYNTARAHLLYVQTIGIGSRYCIFISMSVLGLNQALGRLWRYYKTCYKR